jgi:hypothetical protein
MHYTPLMLGIVFLLKFFIKLTDTFIVSILGLVILAGIELIILCVVNLHVNH